VVESLNVSSSLIQGNGNGNGSSSWINIVDTIASLVI
jgi:hypothetical protein